MSWLLVKSTERKPVAPSTLKEAHLWGDVITIGEDYFPVDHLIPEPFLAIKVDAPREELQFLLEPLVEQEVVNPDSGYIPVYRKRFAINIEHLSSQKRIELCATGKTNLTLYQLENALLQRG